MMTRSEIAAMRAHITGEIEITTAELRAIAMTLLAEVERDRIREQLLRADYVGLLEAARAVIAAAHRHEGDPTSYVEHELEQRGLLPSPEMTPQQLLADAASLRELLTAA